MAATPAGSLFALPGLMLHQRPASGGSPSGLNHNRRSPRLVLSGLSRPRASPRTCAAPSPSGLNRRRIQTSPSQAAGLWSGGGGMFREQGGDLFSDGSTNLWGQMAQEAPYSIPHIPAHPPLGCNIAAGCLGPPSPVTHALFKNHHTPLASVVSTSDEAPGSVCMTTRTA